jgi:drug/metabolite transporter (DMT)-like permease
MYWLPIVLLGHFLNAGAFIVDKILLTKKLPQPALYAFYIGTLGILVLVAIPWANFTIPPGYTLTQAAGSGAGFVLALLCFFSAIKRGDTSRVVPFVGGLIPIFTFPFALIFLGESLMSWQWLGLFFLIGGAILISYEAEAVKNPYSGREIAEVIGAAVLFALSFTLTKAVFRDTEFLNGLIWTRIFAFLTSLCLLMLPSVRMAVLGSQGHPKKPNLLFFVGQAMGGLGFFLLAWAIQLAPSVTIINALQGVQYAFLFILVLMFSRYWPNSLQESLTPRQIKIKSAALLCLAVGLVLVA